MAAEGNNKSNLGALTVLRPQIDVAVKELDILLADGEADASPVADPILHPKQLVDLPEVGVLDADACV